MSIDDFLSNYLDQQISQAKKLDPSFAVLWSHIKDLALRGGKRLRPKLVISTYKQYGGTNMELILPVAAAWEVLHVGLLIHDDIMDGDFERRGAPNVGGIYQDNNIALLAGDLCLNAATDVVLKSHLTAQLKTKIVELMCGTLFEVIGGQLLDIDPKAHDPLQVAQHKTAGYTFVGPMLSGAIVAGANDEDLEQLREVGIDQGIAFQLQNDLEDVEQDLMVGRYSIAIWLMEQQS